MKTLLPAFLKKYFWDTDFKTIDPRKKNIYVTKKILEYGDEQAVAWLFRNRSTSDIIGTLTDYRGYSKKSLNFWLFILNVPNKEMRCLRKRLSQVPKQIWPY